MKKVRIKLTKQTLDLLKKIDDQVAVEMKEGQEYLASKNQTIMGLQQTKSSILSGIILQNEMESKGNWKLEGNELVEQTVEEVDELAKDPKNLLLPMTEKEEAVK